MAWSNVSKTWTAFVNGFFKHNPGASRPEDGIDTVAEAPREMIRWAAARTLLGIANGNTVREVLVLPVVNPSTNQLNRGGLRAANVFAPQVEGVDEDTAESAQQMAERLLRQEFDEETAERVYLIKRGQVMTAEEARAEEDDPPPGAGQTAQPSETNAPVVMKRASVEPEEPKMEPPDESKLRYETRNIATGSVKDVDVGGKTVTGYYASFGNVDAHDDAFVQGAFEETIRERGPDADQQRIKHLNQHHHDQPLGMPSVLKEDDFGLYFETDIIDTRLGEDVLKMYQAGLFEHSVGFRRLGEEEREDGVTLITKTMLFEGSNVTWGANSQTPFTGFKSVAQAQDALMEHVRRMQSVLKEGLTDSVAHQLEIAMAQLEAKVQALQEKQDEANQTSQDDASEDEKDVITLDELTGDGTFFDFDEAASDFQEEQEEHNRQHFFQGI